MPTFLSTTQNSNCVSTFFLYWISSYSMLVVIWYLYWFGGKVKLVQLMCSVLCVLLFCSKLAGLFGGQFASWSPWRLGSTCHMDLCPQCSTGKWRLHYRLHLLTLVTCIYGLCCIDRMACIQPQVPHPHSHPLDFLLALSSFFSSFLSHTDLNQRANVQKLCFVAVVAIYCRSQVIE